MWREKTDKRIVAAGILALGLIVGYQSWDDMQPKEAPRNEFTYTPYVVADEQAELKDFHQGATAAIAWIGDIKAGGETLEYTPSPITPITLPQMSMMLMFRLDTLPKHFSPLFDQIASAVQPWIKAGNIVNDIYIEYGDENPNLEGLAAFTNGLRGHLQREFFIVLQLKRKAFEDDPLARKKLGNMLKSVEFFSYDVKEAAKAGESLAQTVIRIDGQEVPFMLRATDMPDIPALEKDITEPRQYFNGFALDLTAAQRQTEEKKP